MRAEVLIQHPPHAGKQLSFYHRSMAQVPELFPNPTHHQTQTTICCHLCLESSSLHKFPKRFESPTDCLYVHHSICKKFCSYMNNGNLFFLGHISLVHFIFYQGKSRLEILNSDHDNEKLNPTPL